MKPKRFFLNSWVITLIAVFLLSPTQSMGAGKESQLFVGNIKGFSKLLKTKKPYPRATSFETNISGKKTGWGYEARVHFIKNQAVNGIVNDLIFSYEKGCPGAITKQLWSGKSYGIPAITTSFICPKDPNGNSRAETVHFIVGDRSALFAKVYKVFPQQNLDRFSKAQTQTLNIWAHELRNTRYCLPEKNSTC